MALFDRTTRTVRLTEAGRRLLPHAREVLAAASRARAAGRRVAHRAGRDGSAGHQRGAGRAAGPVLAEFARLAAAATIELVTGAIAVHPDPPRAELRALIEACRGVD